MDIQSLTIHDIATGISQGTFSAREVTEAALARIDAYDATYGAFLSTDAEQALASAESIDTKRTSGAPLGPLAGVPVAIKDNLHIEGQPTTCASHILESFKATYNAHVVDELKRAGAVLIGKTNLDEFAMGSSTENSALGSTRNPWDAERVPGGSSGGSAAAVSAGFTPAALGSDTGGSIRAPASFCGVVGFKPTYGAVSRYGLVAFGSSLDQIGPFTRTVADTALVMDVIATPDDRDSTCANKKIADFTSLSPDALKGLRIGLPKEYFETDGLADDVRQSVLAAVNAMKDAGAETVEIRLPMLKYAVPTYYIIATAEASSNLGRYDGAHYGHRAENATDIIDLFSRSREEGFGPEVKRRIMLGTYVLSAGYYDAYYLRALKVRTRIAKDFEDAFSACDIIASPVLPTTAFKIGERVNDPLSMYLSDIYTISANLAGIPGISLPCGLCSEGLPIGIQLLGARFMDKKILEVAAAYEAIRGPAQAAPLA